MVLPEPVLSDDDIKVVEEKYGNPSGLISNTWSADLTKLAVLWAIDSRQARFGAAFGESIASALIQKPVCFLHSYSLEVEQAPH